MFNLFKKKYSRLDEERIIEGYLQELDYSNNFVVDIGASDGIKMSNTYHLFKKGFSGLAIEADPEKYIQLKSNYSKFKNVKESNCKVYPDNIGEVLLKNGCPKDFLLLDLDIDSFDYFVLEAILKQFHPKIIVTEINESVPPPVKFKVLPSKEYVWKGGHFFGYSIACLEDILESYGYTLARLHYNNAFLVSTKYWPGFSANIGESYREGYLEAKNRKRKFRYNKEMDELQTLSADKVIDRLNDKFKDQEGNYDLRL